MLGAKEKHKNIKFLICKNGILFSKVELRVPWPVSADYGDVGLEV